MKKKKKHQKMTTLTNVIVVCLMVHFLRTAAIPSESGNGTTSAMEDKFNENKTENGGAFTERSGTSVGDHNYRPPRAKPSNFQQVYLYRGPNRPLEPYFYRPRMTRRPIWSNEGQQKHRSEPRQSKKTKKVRRDEDVVPIPRREDPRGSPYEGAQTRNRPMRIRYDGAPFESIETLRETQMMADGNDDERGPGSRPPVRNNPNYDTMAGGSFEPVSEGNGRKPAQTSSSEAARSGRRADRPSSSSYHAGRRAKNTPTYARHVHPMAHPSASRDEGRFRVMDHYDGGFSKPQRTEEEDSKQNYHGTELDFETYELHNSGRYGYRTGPEVRQPRSQNIPFQSARHDQSYDLPSNTERRPQTETRQPKMKPIPHGSGSVRHRSNDYEVVQNGGRRDEDTGRHNRRPNKTRSNRPPPRIRSDSNIGTHSYSFVAETSSRNPRSGGARSRSAPEGRGGPQYVPGMELASEYDYEYPQHER